MRWLALIVAACSSTPNEVRWSYDQILRWEPSPGDPAQRRGAVVDRENIELALARSSARVTIRDDDSTHVFTGTAQLVTGVLAIDAVEAPGIELTMRCTRGDVVVHRAENSPVARCATQASDDAIDWRDGGEGVDAWVCDEPRIDDRVHESGSLLTRVGGKPVFAAPRVERVLVACCFADTCDPAGDGLRFAGDTRN